jgi:hypothetical protein
LSMMVGRPRPVASGPTVGNIRFTRRYDVLGSALPQRRRFNR